MTRTLVIVLALSHGALQAQQQPLAGSWQVTYPAGMRIENGVETPLIATGSLTIEPRADSLIATLATDPSPDMPPRPPLRLAAKAGTGEATFVAHSKGTINMNGNEREIAVTSTWVLRATGDSLEGSIVRAVDDAEPVTPREPGKVTGVRKKG